MNDGVFEQARGLLGMREVAEYLGLTINRSGYILCPFHREKTPSCKLYRDGFHCFSCGAHGDQVALCAAVRGVSQFDALKELNDTFLLMLDVGGGKKIHPKRKLSTFAGCDFREWRSSACDLLAWWCRYFARLDAADELASAEQLHDALLCSPPEAAYQFLFQEVQKYVRTEKLAEVSY